MGRLDQRILIYTAVTILCGATTLLVGTAAGVFTFVQIVAVIELIYWMARPAGRETAGAGR